jgi:hypothetical protein
MYGSPPETFLSGLYRVCHVMSTSADFIKEPEQARDQATADHPLRQFR